MSSFSSLNVLLLLILVVDGVPKDGLRIGDVLVRLATLMLVKKRVSLLVQLMIMIILFRFI